MNALSPLPVPQIGSELPLISMIGADPGLMAAAPFNGVGLIVLLHLRPSVAAMINSWIAQGAEVRNILVVAKTYRYPEECVVKASLDAVGIEVVSVNDLVAAVTAFLARLGDSRFVVVEDGGHVLPLVYDDPRLIGAVEQTTKGIHRTKDIVDRLRTPYLSLPHSQFKRRFEPSHVARAAVAAIERALAGHARLGDLSAAIIGGAGTIGASITEALRPMVRSLAIYDNSEPKDFQLLALGRFRVATSVRDAVVGSDLVIGSTGQCVVRGRDIHAFKDGAILASTGSERTEFPLAMIERLSLKKEPFRSEGAGALAPVGTIYTLRPHGKRLVILNDGEPVNFGPTAPAEPAVFDLIMAAILIGSIELAQGRYAGKTGVLDVFDSIVDRHQLDELFLALQPDAGAQP